MQVIKLGGSVLTRESTGNHVITLIRQAREPTVFVVSALRGITDYLASSLADKSVFNEPERVAEEILGPYRELAERHFRASGILECFTQAAERERTMFIRKAESHTHDTRAYCLSSGERLSALLVAGLILKHSSKIAEIPGLPCLFPEDAASFAKQFFCNDKVSSSEARMNRPAVLKKALLAKLQCSPLIAFPGFYAVDPHRSHVLFGRGGSDYSAVAVAAALGTGCVLCKDTGTFLSADPGLISATKAVACISYREAASLAKGGAKIIHKGAIALAKKHRVPLLIADAEGNASTMVRDEERPDCSIKSISARSIKNLAELSIVGEGITRESTFAVRALQSLFEQSIIPRSLSFDRLGHTIRIFVSGEQVGNALRVLHRRLVEEKELS